VAAASARGDDPAGPTLDVRQPVSEYVARRLTFFAE
jgi:hypothetical protein